MILSSVDEVWAEDTRHSGRLLQQLNVKARLHACHDHNESAQVERLLARLAEGASIALISDAGTPLISDPGYRLVNACRANGFAVTPIPGASALVAALSVSGLPTDRFAFEGFLPHKAGQRRELIASLQSDPRTLVFYESTHRIVAALSDLQDGFGADRAASLARELTKQYESVVTGTLADVCDYVAADANHRRGEFVVMVSGAAKAPDNQAEISRVLAILLPELSVKRASAATAAITGAPRNRVYQQALAMSSRADD